jgi:hypothetical protein
MKILKFILIIILSILSLTSISIAQDERDIIKAEEDSDAEEFKTDRLAIVVGINNYLNDKIPDLRFSEPDAKLIKSILEDKGVFNVLYYSSEDDSRGATKDNILNGLKDANSLAKNGLIKTFVFYFAGHGYRHDGENYLAPVEINLNDIEYTGIALSEVLNIINDIQKNAKTMVFLDACRNEVEGSRRGGSESWAEEETPGSGLGIIFSTSEGQYSYELEEEGHGIFTVFLAKGMLGQADLADYGGNGDGFVTFFELASYVSKKLLEWSANNAEQISQTPRVTALEINGDFILTKADEELTIDDIEIDINNSENNNNNSNNNKDEDDKLINVWSVNINFTGGYGSFYDNQDTSPGFGLGPSLKVGYDINKQFSVGLFASFLFDTYGGIYLPMGGFFRMDILGFIPIIHHKHDLYALLGIGVDIINLGYEVLPLSLMTSLKYYYNLDNGVILGGGINFILPDIILMEIYILGFEATFGFRF